MPVFFRLLAMLCALFFTPVASAAEAVTVFAAASLKEALDEVAEAWRGEVVISYGGSGLMARQVAAGAPAEVVILANAAWMDWLQDQGLIAVQTRLNLLGNSLVVVAPAGTGPVSDIVAALGDGRLAIGQTGGVPAGIYGRQWLERAGLWPALQGRLAETENVRAALALVSRGEALLGLVYATDARADDAVAVVYDVPTEMHQPIVYPAALTDVNSRPQTVDFMAFLNSEAASEIFARHGFVRPETRP